jgi:hypothetical protein
MILMILMMTLTTTIKIMMMTLIMIMLMMTMMTTIRYVSLRIEIHSMADTLFHEIVEAITSASPSGWAQYNPFAENADLCSSCYGNQDEVLE